MEREHIFRKGTQWCHTGLTLVVFARRACYCCETYGLHHVFNSFSVVVGYIPIIFSHDFFTWLWQKVCSRNLDFRKKKQKCFCRCGKSRDGVGICGQGPTRFDKGECLVQHFGVSQKLSCFRKVTKEPNVPDLKKKTQMLIWLSMRTTVTSNSRLILIAGTYQRRFSQMCSCIFPGSGSALRQTFCDADLRRPGTCCFQELWGNTGTAVKQEAVRRVCTVDATSRRHSWENPRGSLPNHGILFC